MLAFVLLLFLVLENQEKWQHLQRDHPTGVKGQQVYKKQQGQETLLVNMTSRGQRVAKMLVGITTDLKFKDGFEGGCCTHYSPLSILSLLSCKR